MTNKFRDAFGDVDYSTKPSMLSMCCNIEEKEYMERKASDFGLSVPEFIRMLVLRGIEDFRRDELKEIKIKQE